MKNLIFHSSKKASIEFFRALSYSGFIAAILLLLIVCRNEGLISTFRYLSLIGLIVIVCESFFTLLHTDSVAYKKGSYYLKSSLYHHTLNHLFYPVIFYLGLTTYILYGENSLISNELTIIKFVFVIISFLLYLAHFYLLRDHVHNDHVDVVNHKIAHFKVDIVYDFFKFFTYFIINLALFDLLFSSRVTPEWVFIVILNLNLTLLLFHLNRKYELSFINVFIAILFSAISTLFIFRVYGNSSGYSATLSTIVFYLASGLFYHKVDGTLNNKILIEYISISVILSLLLFSF